MGQSGAAPKRVLGFAKAHVKLAQEEGKEWRRYRQRRRKDNPEVAQVHLGRVGILRDRTEMGEADSKQKSYVSSPRYSGRTKPSNSVAGRHSQKAEERVLFYGKLLDQLAERIDLVLAPAQV